MPTLKEIMTPDVDVVSPDATAEDASVKMRDLNVGAVPVCDEVGLIGMVTDRDLVVRVMAERRDPKAVRVGEAMTPEVIFCMEDDDAEKAAHIMAQKQIRRLPVLSKDKKLVGIVSLGDLAVNAADRETGGRVLERVSQPPRPQR
jgi:CBS domain-containing protein